MEGICYINDPECIQDSKKHEKTRSELAIQKAMDKINNGIVVLVMPLLLYMKLYH